MAAVTICSHFRASKIKYVTVSIFLHLFVMKWWDQMHDLHLLNVKFYASFFHSPLSPSLRGSLALLCFLPLVQSVSSVAQSCSTLCDPMNCRTPGLPVHHHLPEFTQNHIHWVHDGIQPSHPLSSPSPPAFNLSQHQGLFRWVSSLYQVAKVLEFQLQSFQWIFRVDFL